MIFENFETNKFCIDDDLVKEILLYQIDYFRFLMNYKQLHDSLNIRGVVNQFIEMLKVHND